MFNKKIAVGVTCSALVLAVVAGLFVFSNKKEEPVPVEEKLPVKEAAKPHPVKQVSKAVKPAPKKYDLYSSTPYDVPLISVVEISKLTDKAKKAVDEVLESSQGFYFLKFDKEKNKTFVILQNSIDENPLYIRHGLEFAEISEDGNKTFYKPESQVVDSDKDSWEFDNSVEPQRPLKHIVYDEEGKVKFTEVWNYSDKEPVKYEMKNAQNKVVSILKESSDNDSNYRKEHIFYDDEGNTKMSVTANYDGANLSRFTYYNSEDKDNSISIMSEYSQDGLKSKEYIYNTDYELTNTVTSEYENGERKNIRVIDSNGNELEEISS